MVFEPIEADVLAVSVNIAVSTSTVTKKTFTSPGPTVTQSVQLFYRSTSPMITSKNSHRVCQSSDHFRPHA